jgi:hypothetical protein
MCQRLTRQKDENKFLYLYEAYQRLENHIWAKRKQNEKVVDDMKSITARYFVTCLSCPDAFELPNDYSPHADVDTKSAGNQGDMQMQMMQAMMGGQGMPPGGVPGQAESLASGQSFQFTKMQNDVWACIDKTCFHIHR